MYTKAAENHSKILTRIAFTILDRLSSTKARKVSGRPFRRSHFHIGTSSLILAVGWKCCKPRVLTFDEFLEIPPCTTGKHSTIDDTPNPEPTQSQAEPEVKPDAPKPISHTNGASAPAVNARVPKVPQQAAPLNPPSPPESESDDASLPIPPNTTCRRRGCNENSASATPKRDNEDCIYHPGQALFHEGSKGWTCCKRRVLEFDEFMKIEGCKRKKRHLFVGNGKKAGTEETLSDVRYDL